MPVPTNQAVLRLPERTSNSNRLGLERLTLRPCSPEAGAGKLCKAVAVGTHRERPEAGDEHVKAEVEFLTADDVRVGNVALDHVGYRFGRVVPSGTKNTKGVFCSGSLGIGHPPLTCWRIKRKHPAGAATRTVVWASAKPAANEGVGVGDS